MNEPTRPGLVRLTRTQVREIDRRSIEQYQIPGIILMENAARAVADAAWKMLDSLPGRILILCGGGNNGGDGLAVARHLHNRNVKVMIGFTTDPAKYAGDAKTNYEIVSAMGLPSRMMSGSSIDGIPDADLIIDAIFGTGLTGPPRFPFDECCTTIERSRKPVLAIDIPSGLDCDSGLPLGACVRATKTVTFVAEKAGFANPMSRQHTGEIVVGDIGCPRELVDAVRRAG